ncbi:MAG: hypothetical protein ACRDQY_18310 [Pseudonocardiaceae bacterium]
MREPLAPLDSEPVSVHAPFITSPGSRYRHEYAQERRAALLAALDGVALGAYDQRILRWLAGQELPTVAVVVSLLWRARHAVIQQSHRGGGESRG